MTEIFDDIKKMYRFGKPAMELYEYIEFFSESSFEQTTKPCRVSLEQKKKTGAAGSKRKIGCCNLKKHKFRYEGVNEIGFAVLS